MKIEIDFLGADKFSKLQDTIMHAADIFEVGKRCVKYEKFCVEGNEDINLDCLCQNIADAFEKMEGYAVFVGIKLIDGLKPSKSYVWFKRGVQSLSMVQNQTIGWVLFKEALEKLGYEVETDDRMFVTNVKAFV